MKARLICDVGVNILWALGGGDADDCTNDDTPRVLDLRGGEAARADLVRPIVA